MPEPDPPLTRLLSQALVAFTIELDNAFERAMAGSGPWLGSLVLWTSAMRYVDETGVTVAELERLARAPTNLDGLRRWGYVTIDGRGRAGGARPVAPEAVLRATPAGLRARAAWAPLPEAIEQRWCERFGAPTVQRLRGALTAVAARLPAGLPDGLPILGYGLFSRAHPVDPAREEGDAGVTGLPLPALLSRVLLALALAFERRSPVSLAIAVDVLALIDEDGTLIKDLPRRSGVSKEAIAMATGVLGRRGLATIGPDRGGSRFRAVRLTADGAAVRAASGVRLRQVEARAADRLGAHAFAALRAALPPLVGDGTPGDSPLWRGLEPDPAGWRATIRRPATLPHYPMVLHRGGFPDGT